MYCSYTPSIPISVYSAPWVHNPVNTRQSNGTAVLRGCPTSEVQLAVPQIPFGTLFLEGTPSPHRPRYQMTMNDCFSLRYRRCGKHGETTTDAISSTVPSWVSHGHSWVSHVTDATENDSHRYFNREHKGNKPKLCAPSGSSVPPCCEYIDDIGISRAVPDAKSSRASRRKTLQDK